MEKINKQERLKLLKEYLQQNGYSKSGLTWGMLIEEKSHNIFNALRLARHDFRDLIESNNIIL